MVVAAVGVVAGGVLVVAVVVVVAAVMAAVMAAVVVVIRWRTYLWVQLHDQGLDRRELCLGHPVTLVHQDHVGKLELNGRRRVTVGEGRMDANQVCGSYGLVARG